MEKALFKIGQEVKYIGKSSTNRVLNGVMAPWSAPGMLFKITEIHKPKESRGPVTLEIFDNGSNGYNIGLNEHGLEIVIWPEHKEQWVLN